MAWRLVGAKPLSEPMMVSLPTHICVTRPQWVKGSINLLWPCDTIWHQRSWSIWWGNSLLPDGPKPLPHPMLTCHELDHQEHIPINFSNVMNWTTRITFQSIFLTCSFKKMYSEIPSAKCYPYCSSLIVLTHWGQDKMAAIFQKTFSNAFSWMKMYKFRLRFHWSFFPRVQITIFDHCFR